MSEIDKIKQEEKEEVILRGPIKYSTSIHAYNLAGSFVKKKNDGILEIDKKLLLFCQFHESHGAWQLKVFNISAKGLKVKLRIHGIKLDYLNERKETESIFIPFVPNDVTYGMFDMPNKQEINNYFFNITMNQIEYQWKNHCLTCRVAAFENTIEMKNNYPIVLNETRKVNRKKTKEKKIAKQNENSNQHSNENSIENNIENRNENTKEITESKTQDDQSNTIVENSEKISCVISDNSKKEILSNDSLSKSKKRRNEIETNDEPPNKKMRNEIDIAKFLEDSESDTDEQDTKMQPQSNTVVSTSQSPLQTMSQPHPASQPVSQPVLHPVSQAMSQEMSQQLSQQNGKKRKKKKKKKKKKGESNQEKETNGINVSNNQLKQEQNPNLPYVSKAKLKKQRKKKNKQKNAKGNLTQTK